MLRIKDKFLPIILLTLTGYISLFINLNVYEFRGEESLRTIVAFEMKYFNSWFQPTLLGDYYYQKPPLFNCLIILSSYIFSWSEFTARVITLISLGLTLILIYRFTYKLFKDRYIAFLSPLIYLTFADILFWYGYLAEIDITLSLFIFGTLYFQIFGFLNRNKKYIYISGFLVGLSFLLKGFPAYLFYALTFIALVIYTKRFKEFLNSQWWISTAVAITIPLIVFIKNGYLEKYITSLLYESLVRAKGGTDIVKLIKHIITYPLLNFKQLLPTSVFVLIGFWLIKRNKYNFNIPNSLKLLILIVFINYLPYLLSVESRGRYIIPLFPFLSVIFAYILTRVKSERFHTYFYYTLISVVILRLLLGIVGFHILMKFKESRKRIAYDISKTIDINKSIAFDCVPEKSIAVYLDFLRGKPVLKSKFTPNWDYLITCDKQTDKKVVKEYKLKGKIIYLYKN